MSRATRLKGRRGCLSTAYQLPVTWIRVLTPQGTVIGELFKAAMNELISSDANRKRFYLLIGNERNELTSLKFLVGRAETNNLTLEDESVSSHHAIIRKAGDGYRVQDLNSTNGTFINGERVSDGELTENDQLVFGNIECIFLAVEITAPEANGDGQSMREKKGADVNHAGSFHWWPQGWLLSFCLSFFLCSALLLSARGISEVSWQYPALAYAAVTLLRFLHFKLVKPKKVVAERLSPQRYSVHPEALGGATSAIFIMAQSAITLSSHESMVSLQLLTEGQISMVMRKAEFQYDASRWIVAFISAYGVFRAWQLREEFIGSGPAVSRRSQESSLRWSLRGIMAPGSVVAVFVMICLTSLIIKSDSLLQFALLSAVGIWLVRYHHRRFGSKLYPGIVGRELPSNPLWKRPSIIVTGLLCLHFLAAPTSLPLPPRDRTPAPPVEEVLFNFAQERMDQTKQDIFSHLHPQGTAKEVVVHDLIVTKWKGEQPSTDVTDVREFQIRYTVFWSSPLIEDGYTKVEQVMDLETRHASSSKIISTNANLTNEDVASLLIYSGDIILAEIVNYALQD